MLNNKYKPLNMNVLRSKKTTIVSSEEALKDITPIDWSKDVLSGRKKVTIISANLDKYKTDAFLKMTFPPKY